MPVLRASLSSTINRSPVCAKLGAKLASRQLSSQIEQVGRASVIACAGATELASITAETPKTDKPLNIVFVSTEVAPWSKTGGLGDVVGGLPIELAKRGHHVVTVAPRWDVWLAMWRALGCACMRVYWLSLTLTHAISLTTGTTSITMAGTPL